MGQRDRALPHAGHRSPFSQDDPTRGHYETQWGGASAGRHHLRRLPLPGSVRGRPPCWFVRRTLRPLHGDDTDHKRNEGCRCRKRRNSSRCSSKTQMAHLGERARGLLLLRRRRFPRRPRGDRPHRRLQIICSWTSGRTLGTCWGHHGNSILPRLESIGRSILGRPPATQKDLPCRRFCRRKCPPNII